MQKYRIRVETTSKGSKYYPEELSKFLWFESSYISLRQETSDYFGTHTFPVWFETLQEAEDYLKDLNPTVTFIYPKILE